MWHALFSAIALVFVLEGILPFLCPDCWRQIMARMAQQPSRTLRIAGLISMAIGIILLYIIHHHLLS